MGDVTRPFHEGIRSVRAARRFVLDTLVDWGVAGYDFGAPLVVTELATNAVLFSPPPYRVKLTFDGGRLRVEVHDSNGRLPRLRNYGPEATTGRGLHLVDGLCDDWGATRDDAGKIVWATVRPDDEAARPLPPEQGQDSESLTAPAPTDRRSTRHRSLEDFSNRPGRRLVNRDRHVQPRSGLPRPAGRHADRSSTHAGGTV